MSKTKLAVFTVMLLGAAGVASADQRNQGHRPDASKIMQKLDANDDGQISRREFADKGDRDQRAARGEHRNRDRDQRADRPTAAQRFERLDRNNDGSLSIHELARRTN